VCLNRLFFQERIQPLQPLPRLLQQSMFHVSPKEHSLPKNWPNPTEEDLQNKPNRIISIGGGEQQYLFRNNFVKTSKYEWYNFFPKFLFEEFDPRTKIANCYFLLVSALQCVPAISNTFGVPTTLIPLLFVILVDGIFAFLEDYSRHKADTDANSSLCDVYSPTTREFLPVKWADIHVGDFVLVKSRGSVPADLVIFGVAERTKIPQGICYVETKSLDGETNLKIRNAVPNTLAVVETSFFSPLSLSPFLILCVQVNGIAALQQLRGDIRMEHPNNLIDTFNGVLTLDQLGKEAIMANHLLLRGCVLRNTDWVIGCVVNTGHDTKIMMSATGTPSKTSFLERSASSQIQRIIVLLALVCIAGSTGATVWNKNKDVSNIWYLSWNPDTATYFVVQFFYFFLLHATFIPVSLYVSMTLVRFFQSYFMNNDLEMYYEPTDTPALVRTMTLNEELGQISHVFTDKTGTLTCNVMDFRKASINGVSYGLGITEIGKASWKLQGKPIPDAILQGEERAKACSVPHVSFFDPLFEEHRQRSDLQSQRIQEFFRILALCHDTIAEKIEGGIRLSASNPDDECLLCAATYFGFEFRDRESKTALVWNRAQQVMEQTEILDSISFSSRRKRMSVVTRAPSDGKIRVYIKGADNVMFPRLKPGQESMIADTDDHLRVFSIEGLRCLLVGQREITLEEYKHWSARYADASTSLAELEKKKNGLPNLIEALEDELEQQFILVGCTAIEDKLQDGVPEAIGQIARAGVNIWVLTGDKEETAINIAVACNLVLPTEYMRHVIVNKKLYPTIGSIIDLFQAEIKVC
jgi:phospholipid-transporting ATPase